MEADDWLKVERVGGFAGFGLPGSALKSVGQLPLSALSADDLKQVNAMFSEIKPSYLVKPDEFQYRITRMVANEPQTIEVPETHVPMPIRKCVRDSLD
jgi:hypothetical protein